MPIMIVPALSKNLLQVIWVSRPLFFELQYNFCGTFLFKEGAMHKKNRKYGQREARYKFLIPLSWSNNAIQYCMGLFYMGQFNKVKILNDALNLSLVMNWG